MCLILHWKARNCAIWNCWKDTGGGAESSERKFSSGKLCGTGKRGKCIIVCRWLRAAVYFHDGIPSLCLTLLSQDIILFCAFHWIARRWMNDNVLWVVLVCLPSAGTGNTMGNKSFAQNFLSSDVTEKERDSLSRAVLEWRRKNFPGLFNRVNGPWS